MVGVGGFRQRGLDIRGHLSICDGADANRWSDRERAVSGGCSVGLEKKGHNVRTYLFAQSSAIGGRHGGLNVPDQVGSCARPPGLSLRRRSCPWLLQPPRRCVARHLPPSSQPCRPLEGRGSNRSDVVGATPLSRRSRIASPRDPGPSARNESSSRGLRRPKPGPKKARKGIVVRHQASLSCAPDPSAGLSFSPGWIATGSSPARSQGGGASRLLGGCRSSIPAPWRSRTTKR